MSIESFFWTFIYKWYSDSASSTSSTTKSPTSTTQKKTTVPVTTVQKKTTQSSTSTTVTSKASTRKNKLSTKGPVIIIDSIYPKEPTNEGAVYLTLLLTKKFK